MLFKHIEDLVSLDVLDKLLEEYYEVTGMASCINDARGRVIIKKCFTPACELIRTIPELEKLCIQSDAFAGLTASMLDKPYIYECPCGLVDCAVPIFVENNCIGQIMTGQVLLKEEDSDKISSIAGHLPVENISKDILQYRERFRDELHVLSLKEITVYTNLLKIFAQMISNICYQNLMSEKYREQEIEYLKKKKEISDNKALVTKLRLNLLENQIPVQFLLDSFNTIYQQAIIENATETSNSILSLTTLFHRTLNHNGSLVSLEEEIEFTKKYIQIKNLSRNYKIKIIEQIQSECLGKIIPINTLQSIVEHIFFDRIDKISLSSSIYLSCSKKDRTLSIGLTCDHVKLPIVNIKEEKENNNLHTFFNKTSCISINNLVRMLGTFYNDTYTFNIINNDNHCGKIIITLPISIE